MLCVCDAVFLRRGAGGGDGESVVWDAMSELGIIRLWGAMVIMAVL